MNTGARIPRTEASGLVGALVRNVRLSRRESLESFAKRTGATRHQVMAWETGRWCISFESLVMVAAIAEGELRTTALALLRKRIELTNPEASGRAVRLVLSEVAA